MLTALTLSESDKRLAYKKQVLATTPQGLNPPLLEGTQERRRCPTAVPKEKVPLSSFQCIVKAGC